MTWPGARVGHLLTTLAFLAFVVGQSPHLVHHVFEPDDAEAECVFAMSSDRVCAVAPVVVSLVVDLVPKAEVPIAAIPSVPVRPLAPGIARAPPPPVTG
jgi:hypothetical protein